MEREHVGMPACENFVTDGHDELVLRGGEASTREVGVGGGFFQDREGGDEFTRNQVRADAEILQRALRFCAPEFAGLDLDRAH